MHQNVFTFLRLNLSETQNKIKGQSKKSSNTGKEVRLPKKSYKIQEISFIEGIPN